MILETNSANEIRANWLELFYVYGRFVAMFPLPWVRVPVWQRRLYNGSMCSVLQCIPIPGTPTPTPPSPPPHPQRLGGAFDRAEGVGGCGFVYVCVCTLPPDRTTWSKPTPWFNHTQLEYLPKPISELFIGMIYDAPVHCCLGLGCWITCCWVFRLFPFQSYSYIHIVYHSDPVGGWYVVRTYHMYHL